MSRLLHRGIHYGRTKYKYPNGYANLEQIIADAWERENCATNYGHGILQDLMIQESLAPRRGLVRSLNMAFGWCYRSVVFVIRRRDAVIAATVVQWLGSNCGRDFIIRCFERAGWAVIPPRILNSQFVLEKDSVAIATAAQIGGA